MIHFPWASVALLLCVLITITPSSDAVVCVAPIPHTSQCYAGVGSLGGHPWKGIADCCDACANLTSPVPCAIWINKHDKCMLLAATAHPRSGTDCISGTSLPPAPPKPPSPSPPPGPNPANDPLNPPLPPNRWGPYVGRKSELAPEYGFVSGLAVDCGWGVVEVEQGKFNFSACDEVVQSAIKQHKYIVLNPTTGSNAPLDWLAKAGVPTVKVCFKIDKNHPGKKCTPKLADHSYPYYLAPAYLPLWRKYQQALHDWLENLPKNEQGFRPVQSVQVSLGSTGDITPWHGTPLDPKYAIDRYVWQHFWVNSSRTMWQIHQDLLPNTKLLFNGVPTNSTPEPDNPDAKYWPAYRNLIFDEIKPPNFDMKQGVVSHQYMTSNEHDDYITQGNITRFPYLNNKTGTVEFVRTRGESSDGGLTGPGAGFWMNPTWNLLAMMCWDITYGLDVQNPNPQMWSEEVAMRKCHSSNCSNWTKTLWRPFQHFHTHAGAKEVVQAPGAWLQLRDALDYADAERFPVAQFGAPITRNNTNRLRKIVQHFSPMGAVVQDETSASATRHKSRARLGINTAGWRIWPYNYGQWMNQLNPLGTSVGRWRVGKETNLLGQSTKQTVAGKNMSFVLEKGLFTTKSSDTTGLYVRVAYFDEGHGGWELHYASTKGGVKVGAKVEKQDTGEFIEIRLNITDLDLDLEHGDSAHFVLVDSDAERGEGEDVGGCEGNGWTSSDPDTFAWIEVLAMPFLYQMAEVVHDLGAI